MRTNFSFFLFVIILIKCTNCALDCSILEALTGDQISKKCLTQIRTVCNNDLLSKTMADASSKLRYSGINYTTGIDYGNFYECMSIKEGDIVGKYCGWSAFVLNLLYYNPSTNTIIETLNISSSTNFKNGFFEITKKQFEQVTEIGNRDYLITSLPLPVSKLAMCIPNECKATEVGHFFLLDNIQLPIKVNNQSIKLIYFADFVPCELNDRGDLQSGEIAFITFIAVIITLMIISTIYDAFLHETNKKPLHNVLLAFSILYNGQKLLATSNNKIEQIQVFNGMRFISMCWVVAFHSLAGFEGAVFPTINAPEVVKFDQNPMNRYLNSGVLAVDTFFFMSGFLLAFTYLKKAANESFLSQLYKVPIMYVHRYIRLTPSMAVMYFTIMTVMYRLGQGSIWYSINDIISSACKNNALTFFLYVQNYANPDNMCVLPTWYLSADMQMFILSPLVLIPTALYMKKHYNKVLASLFGLTAFWIICPGLIRYYYDHTETSGGNIYNTHERLVDFLFGITFGYVMRVHKSKPFIFNRLTNFLLWLVVLGTCVGFNLYWSDVLLNYELVKYTLFYTFYRPIWCISLVFMVYSCYHGYGGPISWFLSLDSFQVLAKLTYSMYIIHYMIEMHRFGADAHAIFFNQYMLFYTFCGHIIMTTSLSIFWILAFEYPMLTIDTYLTGRYLTRSGSKTQ